MSQKSLNIIGGVVFQQTLKSHDGSRWEVVAGTGDDAQTAVDNLYDALFEIVPEAVGPLLQKKSKDYLLITSTAQQAFADRFAAAQAHFAKQTVKDKLGAEEVDEDPRESRRYGNTDRDDRYGSRSRDEDPETDSRPRRRHNGDDDDEDERPARKSRSYGDEAAEPRAPHEYCKHGDRNYVEKPTFTAMFCGADRGTPDDEKCRPWFYSSKFKKWSQPKD